MNASLSSLFGRKTSGEKTPGLKSTTRQEWTLMALAERMRARITKTGSNVLPWKIVAFTRSNGCQCWAGRRIFLTKKLAATCFLGSSWLPPTRKKIGSNVLLWKFVASLLLNNFLNNILEFLEKTNSTIVSER